jgi:hypothetical protein
LRVESGSGGGKRERGTEEGGRGWGPGARVEATRGSSCGEASSRRVRAGGRVGWTRWFYRLALPSRDETRSVGVRGVGVRGAVGVAGRWVGVGPFWSWTRRPQAAAPAPRYFQPFFSFPHTFAWPPGDSDAFSPSILGGFGHMASPRGRTSRLSGVPWWWWWCLTCP